jgi:para-nitrobenzyl esterase
MAGFAAGTEAKVPLIIGGNSNEASLTRPTADLFDAMSAEERATVLRVFDPLGTRDRAQVINDYVTVQGVTEPDRAIARLHTRNGAPAWTYYFSYVPVAHRATRPYGAAHTEELPFVFISPRSALAPEDLPVAEAMNAYWAAFARSGGPGSVAGVRWPKWTDAEGQIEFAAGGPRVREQLLKTWRDTAENMIRK